MRRHATTIVLLVLAAALGIFLYVDRDRATEGEKRRREDNVFPAWRRDELSRITIATEGETLVLERDAKGEGAWRMTSPRTERADLQAVERLLTTLEFATIQRKAPAGPLLGLERPRASGTIAMGGLAYRFALGASSPRPEGSSYFVVDDGEPFVVSRELTSTLLAGADVYRDRTVVPYLSIELARFAVERRGGGFTLVHDTENAFRVDVGAGSVLAARDALDRVWGALAAMRAEVFPRDADAPPASDAITLRLTPKDASKPPAVLVVGGECPGHPADVLVHREAPSPLLACAPRSVLDALTLEPTALVLRKPFALRADEIEELVLERLDGDAGTRGPARLEIARKGNTFLMRSPEERDLTEPEADAASELLSRITQTTEASVVTPEGSTFAPAFRARIFAGEHEETVEIGPLDDDVVKVRRTRDGAVLELSRAEARRLVPRRTSVRPRLIMPGESRRPVRIELRCGVPQTLVDTGSGFRLTAPEPGFEADGTAVGLAEALSKGHVDLWVADVDDGRFGLDPDGCHAALVFEEGKETRTVVLGAEGEGGVYGTVSGDPAVFVAPRALRQMLETIYVSRTAVRLPPAEVSGVTVTIPGRKAHELATDAARAAVTGLFADQVLSVGRAPRVTPSLTLLMKGSSGTLRLVCGPGASGAPDGGVTEARRACAVEGLPALFAIDEPRLAPFLGREVAEAGVPR